MRNHKNSRVGEGSAFLLATILIAGTVTASAQTPPKAKPAPPPPRPVPQRQVPPQRQQPVQPNQPIPQRPLPNQQIPPRPQQVPPKPLPNQPQPVHPQPNQPNQPLHPNQPIQPSQPIKAVPKVAVPTDSQGHFKPPVNSTTKTLSGGAKETTTADGTKYRTNAAGKATVISKPDGTIAHINPNNGKPTTISKVGKDGTGVIVHNSPTGVRSINYARKDENGHVVRVVTHGNIHYQERESQRRPGYRIRSYSVDHRSYVHVYHSVHYGRYGYYPVYVPAYYYRPGFYAYFGNPWATAVVFSWNSYPGYGYYGMYFAPTVTYASPSAWMADYVIANNLQGVYAAQQSADPDSTEPQDGSITPIPQDVRNGYIQEIQNQIQADQAQASGQAPADATPGALNPKFRIFQSYSDVDADLNGEQCAITGGDFVRREEDVPDANGTVAVTVVSIVKPSASHCQANARVRVTVDTLQEWYNGFLDSQQQGFEAMVNLQGHNGVPPAPDTLRAANPEGQATPDDPGVLDNAVQEAQTNASTVQSSIQSGGL